MAPLLEFGLTLTLVFYLNRWIHAKPKPPETESIAEEYTSVGERTTTDA